MITFSVDFEKIKIELLVSQHLNGVAILLRTAINLIMKDIRLKFVLLGMLLLGASCSLSAAENQEAIVLFVFQDGNMGSNITSYLTPEQRVTTSRALNDFRLANIPWCIATYADCVANDFPVPKEVTNILGSIVDKAQRAEITTTIARNIPNILRKTRHMPAFLRLHIRRVTQREIDNALATQNTLSVAIQHMKICGDFWVHTKAFSWTDDSSTLNETHDLKPPTDLQITDYLSNYASSYITLETALSLPAGKLMPKHIITTDVEIISREHFNAMNALFTAHPECELVVNFGNAVPTPRFFGGKISHSHLIPLAVRRNSIVGQINASFDTVHELFTAHPECELVVHFGFAVSKPRLFGGNSLFIPGKVHGNSIVGKNNTSIDNYFSYELGFFPSITIQYLDLKLFKQSLCNKPIHRHFFKTSSY